MAPRISPRYPPRRRSSYEVFKANPEHAIPEQRAFWQWAVTPLMYDGGNAADLLEDDDYRVLSKAASGGGFLVPDDVGEMITAAARAASAVAQVAQEIVTESGATLGMPLGGTHGTAAWVAESGAISPSDETITKQDMGAFKAIGKIIVSEELRTDEAVELDSYLSFELGARLGALQENAFTVGDGSGKPLGLVHASSPYTVSTAPTGNTVSYSAAAIQQFYLALGKEYRRDAVWLISADDFGKLAGLVGSGGSLVFPALQNDPPTLYGRPVFVSGDLPVPAASAKSLVFGNMKLAYGIRRVNGIELRRQDELHSDSGHLGYRTVARCDGRPLLSAAAIIGAHSAT